MTDTAIDLENKKRAIVKALGCEVELRVEKSKVATVRILDVQETAKGVIATFEIARKGS